MSVAGRRSEFDAGGDIVLCMSQLQLSTRTYHRFLKLVRTIADLAGSDEIQSAHLAEALHLRSSEDHDGVNFIQLKNFGATAFFLSQRMNVLFQTGKA